MSQAEKYRMVDTTRERPHPLAEFEARPGMWVERRESWKPYVDGITYRVPVDEPVHNGSVLGLPNIPAPEWGDHEPETCDDRQNAPAPDLSEYEPESYEDRVASSRMIGQVLFGAVCFVAGGVVGWITSLVCNWALS